MRRCPLLLIVLLSLGACAPTYVWGDARSVEARLFRMVPAGSTVDQLLQEARRRDWTVNGPTADVVEDGSPTYMDDTHFDCRGRGGRAIPVIVADYSAPF